MSWFVELAGKAESLLNELDEQTGVVLRNHNGPKKNQNEYSVAVQVDPNWPQKKRSSGQRSIKTMRTPSPQHSTPVSHKDGPSHHRQPRANTKESFDPKATKLRKSSSPSPLRSHRSEHYEKKYSLDQPPQTLVSEISNSDIVKIRPRQRKSSLPNDFKLLYKDDGWIYKMQNLEVENIMMKNELNVMNREFLELLYRLRKTEEGNDVNSEELKSTQDKQDLGDDTNKTLDIESLLSEMQQFKVKLPALVEMSVLRYKDKNVKLQEEIDALTKSHQDLVEKYKQLEENMNEKESTQMKLENDLRHAQSTIAELQSDFTRAKEECRRLEKDWEAYKLRVKNMLHAKDSQIKSLQEGVDLSEETKDLVVKIEALKAERDELSHGIVDCRAQCQEMQLSVQRMNVQTVTAERVVAALRDALKEERAARNKAEAHCVSALKELKNIQMESAQTVLNLRTLLREKDDELNRLREASSIAKAADTSALNVADYDAKQDSADNVRIKQLTQTLMMKQTKIDMLLAQNNNLKIQLDKFESRYKAEVLNRTSKSQSVVQVQDGDTRYRTRSQGGGRMLSTFSMRIGHLIRRHPFIRLFTILYMVCLHFWVLTVLFTSTPDYASTLSKS